MGMDLAAELNAMYRRFWMGMKRLDGMRRPEWITQGHPMEAVYKDIDILKKYGRVYYGILVQANTILFEKEPDIDCPAQIVYSTDPKAMIDLELLSTVATAIYSYKNKPLEEVPPEWRELAACVTDEYSYTYKRFKVGYQNRQAEIYMPCIMVFRKHLPGGVLQGRLFPILAAPEKSEAAMILPEQYWSRYFRAVKEE